MGKEKVKLLMYAHNLHTEGVHKEHEKLYVGKRFGFFDFVTPTLLKAYCSPALSVSHIMVPFSSSCYLRNAIHSVVEAVYDPVLHHSLTSDFDTYVYVYTHTCESYYGEATLSQTSWLVS